MMYITLNKIRTTNPPRKYWLQLTKAFTEAKFAIEYEKPILTTEILLNLGFDGFIHVFSSIDKYSELITKLACISARKHAHLIEKHISDYIYKETISALDTGTISTIDKLALSTALHKTIKSQRHKKTSNALRSICAIGTDNSSSLQSSASAADDRKLEKVFQQNELMALLSMQDQT